jgi:hypothetical protein
MLISLYFSSQVLRIWLEQLESKLRKISYVEKSFGAVKTPPKTIFRCLEKLQKKKEHAYRGRGNAQ